MALSPFHLAIPVRDIESTEQFYTTKIGCQVGRRAEKWIDFNFFGHQLSAHVKPDETKQAMTNEVDSEQVPVRHFGVVLDWPVWHELAATLRDREIEFLIEPTIRFAGLAGEQATMFIQDPSGNALEFKSFRSPDQLFAVD